MIEVISPAPLMTTFRWATGELSKILRLPPRQDRRGDRAAEEGHRDDQRRIEGQRREVGE